MNIYYKSIDSTNNEIKRRLASEEYLEEFTVISAGWQTAGRGRIGHEWSSPDGVSVATSMVVYPKGLPEERVPQVTILAAMAVAYAIEELYGLAVQIKWTNDILLSEKKVCGILTERIGGAVVVGIGVNVYPGSFPPELAERATCIAEELSRVGKVKKSNGINAVEKDERNNGINAIEKDKKKSEWNADKTDERFEKETDGGDGLSEIGKNEAALSRNELTRKIWEHFLVLYKKFLKQQDLFFLLKEYNTRLVNAGRIVRIMAPSGAYEARAIEMDENGKLVVEMADGNLAKIDSGEVHIRGRNGYV